MLWEHTFSQAKARELASHFGAGLVPFGTIDPGNHGAIAAYTPATLSQRDPNGLLPRPAYLQPLNPGMNLEAMVALGVRVFFVESQFVSGNARAALTLASKASWLPVMTAGAVHASGEDVRLVWIYPATWHTVLRTRTPAVGKFSKGEPKEYAMQLGRSIASGSAAWVRAQSNRELSQGIADTCCMSQWAADTFWSKWR